MLNKERDAWQTPSLCRIIAAFALSGREESDPVRSATTKAEASGNSRR
jgi:hypothetical protein